MADKANTEPAAEAKVTLTAAIREAFDKELRETEAVGTYVQDTYPQLKATWQKSGAAMTSTLRNKIGGNGKVKKTRTVHVTSKPAVDLVAFLTAVKASNTTIAKLNEAVALLESFKDFTIEDVKDAVTQLATLQALMTPTEPAKKK